MKIGLRAKKHIKRRVKAKNKETEERERERVGRERNN